MSDSPPRRRRLVIIVILLLILAIILLLLLRCSRTEPAAVVVASPPAPGPVVHEAPKPSETLAPIDSVSTPGTKVPDEVLSPATVKGPAEVTAGAKFEVTWIGPSNATDFVTIVRRDAPEGSYTNYADTRTGETLTLTAPIEPGDWELRYVAARSKTVLGRTPITVAPIGATLTAPASVVLGSVLSVTWTGPNNAGDYITLVARDTPDGNFVNFTYTTKGSPLELTAPPEAGTGELRYMTGQGGNVLARRAIQILTPDIALTAPAQATAGALVAVTWAGPNNAGDYVTIVPKTARDGDYGNYTYTTKGSPLTVTAPIDAADGELRYMAGQGAKVLARRAIKIVAAEITLAAPADVVVGTAVSITWTGPNNAADYITIVPKAAKDGTYGSYTNTTKGSPLDVKAPAEAGEAEVRYMSGQGAKVLARRTITIVAKP